MEADVAGASHEGAQNKTGGVTRRDVLDAVTDWRKLFTVVFNVLATLPVSAFGYFMPLIVKGMGYSGVDASLMSVSPFVVGACGLFAFVYASDRFKERSIVVSSSMVLAIVGLVVMYTSEKPKLRYGFVHVCLAGAFTAGPLIVAWLAGNTPEKVCSDLPSTYRTVLICVLRPKDPLSLVSTAGATLPVSSQGNSLNQNTDLIVRYLSSSM
jgi:predicted MFS family arabinose efflux permease